MRFVFAALTPALVIIAVAAPLSAQETRASAAAKFSREFAASDTNKDGVLTRAEVQARIGTMAAGNKKLDPVHTKRLSDLWFTRADANKDGKVTQAEAQALLTATFDAYDANRDGKVGTDERAAAKAGISKGR
ncbi:EF-hand domain-containing protein [Sphingomonas mollis]|uniref:EF-hand domain-containing protein n=1 Tax=Sphingomonas mollis TaxID=2795726 RepID=A0ABS0XR83_9SPHN|nr:EF-hand domain-containing protein [Sphingomonas sp. BT553]MBJ6122546.1 EF-hand domain-containing protein [Sphingomonas sp. BT553]